MTTRTVAVKLVAEVGGYVSKLGQAGAATKGLMGELDTLGKKSPEKFNQLALTAGGAGLSLLAVAGAATKLSMDFDKAMSGVSAATHAGAGELDVLRQAALQAGKDTQFSATEAAQGITELAKAGVSTADVLRGGLKGALDLAAAGQIGVAEAAELSATAMTQFRLAGDKIPHLADLLAAGAGKAQGSVHDMGEALKQSGLVASQFGLSVEDTTGTLSAFASAGLLGSDAGTSFKTMLLQLANPAGKTKDLMAELGINAYNAQGGFVGIANLAGQLQTKLSRLTQAQRDAALAQIFGSDAIRAANVLYQQGQTGIQGWIDKVNDSGYAADTAGRLTDNLAGDLERLTGSLDTLAIQSGSGANAGLRKLAQSAEALVDQLSLLPSWLQSGTVLLAGLTGAALLGFAAFGKVRQSMSNAVDTLSQMGPVGAKAGRGLEVTAKWAGRAAVTFAALEAASAIVSSFSKDMNPQVSALAKGLSDFAKNGKLAGEAARILGKDGENLNDIFQTIDSGFWTDLGNGFAGFIEGLIPGAATVDSSLTKIKERIDALDSGLTELVSSEHADEAAAAFERLAAEGAKHGVSIRELREALPQYAAAADEAAKSTDLAALAQATAANKADLLAGGLQRTAEQGKKVKDVFDQLNGSALSLAGAEDGLYEAFDNATKAVEDNGKTLDVHTEKGRNNRAALEHVAEATRDVLQAMQDNGATTDELNAKYTEARAKFVAAAVAMGYTRAQAEALANTWLQMPAAVTTPVKTPGLDTALSRTRKLEDQLDRLDGSVTTAKVMTEFYNHLHDEITGNRWGGVYQHAATGLLREASVYSAQSPARYAFAEPATGGEAFVPRKGDYGRSMSILSRAAQWYGAAVVPWRAMPGGGGSSAPTAAAAAPALTPEALGRAVRSALQGMTVTMDGRRVGELTGRQADIYRRTTP